MDDALVIFTGGLLRRPDNNGTPADTAADENIDMFSYCDGVLYLAYVFRLFAFSSDIARHSGEPVWPPSEYRYMDAFSDDTDDEYKLKLFGLASRQMNDVFRLLVDALERLLGENACGGQTNVDRCGFELDWFFDVFNLPPRIGKHGVHGCRAVWSAHHITLM